MSASVGCLVCSCTHREPCNPSCDWSVSTPNICTTCEDAIDALIVWFDAANKPSRAALWRQVVRRQKKLGGGSAL